MSDILKEITDSLPKVISESCFEGANIVLYTDNADFFISGEAQIKDLVNTFKKRIELRADKKILEPEDKVKLFIENTVPSDAEITNIIFDVQRSIVVVEAKKPASTALEYSHEAELSLVKLLIRFPEVLSQIAMDYEVQKLPNYALEIADKFHQFYHQCRVINQGQVDASRLALVSLTQKVLSEVLVVIGISAPEKM